MLDKIGTEINNFAKMFPIEPSLANFTVYLNEQQKTIESYYPQIDQIDFYRYNLNNYFSSYMQAHSTRASILATSNIRLFCCGIRLKHLLLMF